MTASRWVSSCGVGVLLCAVLVACAPGRSSEADEEREPHYLTGQNLARQMDYEGAIEAYEKATQVNPRSSSAHWELAGLYEAKATNPAAAIYHYQRFLKLRPDSGRTDVAQQRINVCKIELAKSVSSIASLSAAAQRDLERLLAENKDLKAQVAQWNAYYPTRGSGPAPGAPARPHAGAATNVSVPQQINMSPRAESTRMDAPASGNAAARPVTGETARTHTVKTNETMTAIARRYGVSVAALQAANPQVDARRMRVGSTLSIPAR